MNRQMLAPTPATRLHGRPAVHAAAWSLVLMLALAGGAAAQGLANASAAPLSGDRTLEPRPIWMSSASWSLDGSSLLVVDALKSRVIAYPLAGGPGAEVAIDAAGGPAVSRPSILHTLGDAYLLEEEDALIVRLDREFRVTAAYDLLKHGAGAQGRITGLYQWVPLGADVILGFAELQVGAGRGESRHVSGFIRVPLDRPAEFELLATVDHGDPARDYYRVGYPYLASVSERGYYLLMDREPKLFAVDGNGTASAQPLAAVPAEVRVRPQLPNSRGAGGVKELFRVLQTAQIPAGLYGWDGRLYLLSRVGGEWVLTALDAEGAAAGSVGLPAGSPHLLAVPGDPEWALIEKGPVESLGDQRIDTVRLVASSTLRLSP